MILIEHLDNDLVYIIWLEPYMKYNRILLGEIKSHFGRPSVTLVHHASYIGSLPFLHGLQVFGSIMHKKEAN